MKKNQEVEQLFNYLVEKCVNDFDGILDKVYIGSGDTTKGPHSILKSEKDEFDKLCSILMGTDAKLSKTVSERTFSKNLLEYIWNCKKNNKKISYKEIEEDYFGPLKSMEIESQEVFHVIEGIEILDEVPKKIGNFTFYNFEKHREYLEKEYPNQIKEEKSYWGLDKKDNWVSVQVVSREHEKAGEIALEQFGRLQNIFRFMLHGCNSEYDIGITNFRKQSTDGWVVFSKETGNATEKFAYNRKQRRINISLLFDEFPAKMLEINRWIENISKPEELSEIEKRIMNAIDLYGRAVYDYGTAIGFQEAMLSVEALLQINLGEFISKSISAEISEACALLLSNTYKERVEIEKKIKSLYGIRSKIAHGASMNINIDEYQEMIRYAYSVIVSLILRRTKYKINKVEDLQKHIQMLRYM